MHRDALTFIHRHFTRHLDHQGLGFPHMAIQYGFAAQRLGHVHVEFNRRPACTGANGQMLRSHAK